MLLMKEEMIESDDINRNNFNRDGSKFLDIRREGAHLVIERRSNKEVGESVRVHVCACQAVPGQFPLEKLDFDRVVVLVVDQDCGKSFCRRKKDCGKSFCRRKKDCGRQVGFTYPNWLAKLSPANTSWTCESLPIIWRSTSLINFYLISNKDS